MKNKTIAAVLFLALAAPALAADVVADFGADPTGINDSASNFTAAFSSMPTGGVLNVPPGTYKIASTVGLTCVPISCII